MEREMLWWNLLYNLPTYQLNACNSADYLRDLQEGESYLIFCIADISIFHFILFVFTSGLSSEEVKLMKKIL